MKLVRRIIISLSIALFAVCCGAVLLFNWSVTGWKALTVPTSSMRPTIPQGSLVLMHSVPNSSLKVGDVITYTNLQKKGKTTTHRIIKNYKIDGKIPAFIARGDANPSPDPPVAAGLVQGKAVLHVPYLGGVLDWTKRPVGLLALIYIPAILLMIEEVQRLNTYWRKSRPYKSALVIAREVPEPKNRLAMASAISVALVAGSALFAIPVQALLRSNTVALTNNIISAASTPVTGKHVLFRTITLRCSSNNTLTASKRPKIVIYNATSQNITTHGWHIDDNSGAVINIPDGKVLKRLHQYVFTPFLADGLQFSGDHLSVFNDKDQAVDSLSWGTDISAFSPSISSVAAGTQLQRRPFNKDTDKAADWRVFDHVCHCPVSPDVQAGDDNGDFGDLNEPNRVQTLGAFNMQEI